MLLISRAGILGDHSKADSYDSDLALDALSAWLLPGLVIRWLACQPVP